MCKGGRLPQEAGSQACPYQNIPWSGGWPWEQLINADMSICPASVRVTYVQGTDLEALCGQEYSEEPLGMEGHSG